MFHKDTFRKIYLKFQIYRTQDINNLIFMRFILGIFEYFRLVWCLSPFLSEPFPWKFWNISSFQASLSLKLVKLVHEVNQYVGFRVTTGWLPSSCRRSFVSEARKVNGGTDAARDASKVLSIIIYRYKISLKYFKATPPDIFLLWSIKLFPTFWVRGHGNFHHHRRSSISKPAYFLLIMITWPPYTYHQSLHL